MKYFKSGYYLIKQKPINYGSLKNKIIYTCSTCINDSLLCNFSRSWTVNDDDIISAKNHFKIDDEIIKNIHNWTNINDLNNNIGFNEVFNEIRTAQEYKNLFFNHLDSILLLGLYLPENDANNLINSFQPKSNIEGEIGLCNKLNKKELDNDTYQTIGYDLIGVECGGNFHSFHCHDLSKDLQKYFNIKINDYGLIDSDDSWKQLTDFMNDQKNGFEPVQWYLAKVKLIELKAGA